MTSGKKSRFHYLKRAVNYTLSFLLSALFLYIAFHDVDFGEVMETVSNASLFWVITFLVVSMFSHYLRAVRWKFILNSVKPDTKMKNLFGALMVGYGVNCVVPRFGEITRAVLIGRWEGLSRSSMFGAVIVERIIDLIFLGVAVSISLFIWSDGLSESFPWLETATYITMFGLTATIIFLYLLIKFRERFYHIITNIVNKFSHHLADKITHIFDMLLEGFGSLKGTKNYILTFILSALIITFYAVNAYIGFFTVGMQNIQPVTFAMGWVLMSVSAIGVVIPTPGGTGSYHTLAKTTLMLFGFGEVISLSYAFLTHIVSYFMFIITALLSFLILSRQHENLLKVLDTEVDEL